MKCSEEEKQERLKAQKEAQQRMEEKKQQDKEKRLKELADEKQKVRGVQLTSVFSRCPSDLPVFHDEKLVLIR